MYGNTVKKWGYPGKKMLGPKQWFSNFYVSWHPCGSFPYFVATLDKAATRLGTSGLKICQISHYILCDVIRSKLKCHRFTLRRHKLVISNKVGASHQMRSIWTNRLHYRVRLRKKSAKKIDMVTWSNSGVLNTRAACDAGRLTIKNYFYFIMGRISSKK